MLRTFKSALPTATGLAKPINPHPGKAQHSIFVTHPQETSVKIEIFYVTSALPTLAKEKRFNTNGIVLWPKFLWCVE